MIVHIVMFKFKEEDKQDNINKVRLMLEELEDKIDSLNKMEVGIDFNRGSRAFDLSLYSTFDTKDDLQKYQIHPSHVEVKNFITEVTQNSVVVDYEINSQQ